MPKVRTPNSRPPEARQRLTEELRKLYGGAMTLADVMEALGVKDSGTAKKWVKAEGLEAIEVNGRKKWLTSDVARALDNSKIRTA